MSEHAGDSNRNRSSSGPISHQLQGGIRDLYRHVFKEEDTEVFSNHQEKPTCLQYAARAAHSSARHAGENKSGAPEGLAARLRGA